MQKRWRVQVIGVKHTLEPESGCLPEATSKLMVVWQVGLPRCQRAYCHRGHYISVSPSAVSHCICSTHTVRLQLSANSPPCRAPGVGHPMCRQMRSALQISSCYCCLLLPAYAGDGQGNCAGVRKAAAAAMVSWLARDPTGTNATDYLIMGDFNAYAREDAIMELINANYTNLIEQHLGANAYSFVFDARKGYLDHALASPGMLPKVIKVAEWHTNAAEPTVLDYNAEYKTANQDALYYSPDPVRYSDHDPVIADLCFSDCALRANESSDDAAAAIHGLGNDTGISVTPKATMITSRSAGLPESRTCRWLLCLLMGASLLIVGNLG